MRPPLPPPTAPTPHPPERGPVTPSSSRRTPNKPLRPSRLCGAKPGDDTAEAGQTQRPRLKDFRCGVRVVIADQESGRADRWVGLSAQTSAEAAPPRGQTGRWIPMRGAGRGRGFIPDSTLSLPLADLRQRSGDLTEGARTLSKCPGAVSFASKNVLSCVATVGNGLPDIRQAIAEVGNGLPNIRQTVRYLGDALPSIRQTVRYFGDALPSIRQAVRYLGNALPSIRQTVRYLGKAFLRLFIHLPHLGNVLPKLLCL